MGVRRRAAPGREDEVAFDFGGKVAAVTGGASGIGLGLADRLAEEGAAVAIADVDPSRLAAVAERRPGVLTMEVDVSDPAQTDSFAAAVAERFGAIHVVCANAGIIGPAGPRLWEVPVADWRRVVDVNLLGVVNTLRSFVPWLLRSQPAHVAITSSMAGVTTSATMPAYFATKHALVSLAETLRLQLERDGLDIGVSVLLPARVTTNLDQSLTGGVEPSAGVPGFNPRQLTPDQVADRFVAAVRAGQLYVFTHAESVGRVQARADALLDAFAPIQAAPAERAR